MTIRCLASVLLVASLAAPPALAKGKGKGKKAEPGQKAQSNPEKAAAAKLLNEGNEAYSSGDYARSLDRYEAAYEKFPSAKILFNLGEAHFALKQLGAAADAYDRFLASATADAAPDRLVRARQRAAQLSGVVGQLRVSKMPADARIEIDGKPVATDRVVNRVFVDAGSHEVRAKDDGELSLRRNVQCDAGKLTVVELEPTTARGTAPIAGTTRVDSSDERLVATPPQRRSVMKSPAVIVPLTLTVAFTLGLIGTGAATLGFHDRYDDPARSPSSRDFARRTGEGLQWASEGLLIGAAVSAVVTTTVAVILHVRNKRAR